MNKGKRSAWQRYGFAILLFAVIVAISLTLSYFSIRISLSIVMVIVLVAATLYGGRGPGLLLAALIQGRMVQLNGFPAESPLGQVVFGYASSFSLLVFLIFIISGLKKKAMELREHRELLRVTLSSIGDAVITTDNDGTINFLNPAATELTGWEPETALGKPLKEVFRIVDEETKVPVSYPLLTVDGDITVPDAENRTLLVPREGAELPIEHRTAPIRDTGGDTIGAVIVFRDISRRRKAEEALLETEHRLQQSQKMEAIGTLTGGVAHDFNNLLTAILGYTHLAQKKLDTGQPIQPLLAEVENAGNRAAELTRQLLAFSRRQRLDQRNISITDTIGSIFKLLERIIGADIKIIIKHSSGVMPVFADPAQIEQVILNLSVNARDAMPAGGRLIIETDNVELDENYCSQYPDVEPGKYVQIRVTDSGVGMDAETQSRIFEPFFTTKEVNKGTGLGLSMAYGIVKQHGGHISVYSERGQGTAFNVFLPAVDAALQESARTVERFTEGGTETVLIAEDEDTLRNLSKDLLESLGYKVLSTRNGEEAVAMIEAGGKNIDILLFDVVMPSMGGLEAYEKIRGIIKREMPIIFMTGYSPEFVQDKFVRNKQLADMPEAKVIQKPYTLDALGRAVREALVKNDEPANIPREPVTTHLTVQ